MRAEIAPSILSFPLASVFEPVREIVAAGADLIHFDVMDGQFVPPITFGAALVESLKGVGDILFEAHLMTETPEAHFEAFAAAGCKRIIFHAEATKHAHRLCQQLHSMGIQAGLAINPATPVNVFEPVLAELDMGLIMTVNPGWGGQKMISACLDKVTKLRAMAPNLPIQVDGGMDPVNLPIARQAGANIFVVGSYLTGPEGIPALMKNLRNVCG
ncbi:MAG: ribulose-phosphate 3-epimerase [Armatimonadetes bacterium]|nr:ribulose-phosphate 3-epimerase [Armatimonadota bacterium]